MLQSQLHARALAPRLGPGLDRRCARIKCDGIRIRIAGCANADGLQALLVQISRNSVEIQILPQQLPQRGIVEQRTRRMNQPAPGEQRQHPVQSGLQDADRIRPDHLVHPEVAPHPLNGVYGLPEMRRIRGESDGADRAGGSAGNDLKRAAGTAPHKLGDALEHAHLIGGARPAAGQYQPQLGCIVIHDFEYAKGPRRICGPASRSGESAWTC